MKDYITNYEEAVEFLYRIPRFNSNHCLEHIRQFLRIMGSPDEKIPIVHIAGTNGKGSTSNYLATLLRASGLKVGLFTSPHLVDIRERFQINGEMIEKALLVEAVQKVESLLEQMPGYAPCFFDMMFFVGMYAFSKEEVDILILETGLGGTLDATNAVSKKVLTLITHIGLDHTELLGETLDAIATEKAGIMMRGVPLVVGSNNEAVAHVFIEKAKALDTCCRILGKGDFFCRGVLEKSVAFSYVSRYYGTIHIALSTSAIYQIQNATLALAGLDSLIDVGLIKVEKLPLEKIQEALALAVWPGRMEEVARGVYLDGAHNLDGIEAFLKSVSEIECVGKRYLVFSAVSDKDYPMMLKTLLDTKFFDEIVVTSVHGERAVEAKMLYQSLLSANALVEAKCIPDLKDALEYVFTKQKQIDDIYIVGSLYLVGQTKKLFSSHLEFSAKEEGEIV